MNGLPTHKLALVALLTSLVACGAPAAQMATGAIANDVERAMQSGSAMFDHGAWDGLLRDGTRDGFVDYQHMAGNRATLDAYLARLAGADLGSSSRMS